jgi:hypothetical protein
MKIAHRGRFSFSKRLPYLFFLVSRARQSSYEEVRTIETRGPLTASYGPDNFFVGEIIGERIRTVAGSPEYGLQMAIERGDDFTACGIINELTFQGSRGSVLADIVAGRIGNFSAAYSTGQPRSEDEL